MPGMIDPLPCLVAAWHEARHKSEREAFTIRRPSSQPLEEPIMTCGERSRGEGRCFRKLPCDVVESRAEQTEACIDDDLA